MELVSLITSSFWAARGLLGLLPHSFIWITAVLEELSAAGLLPWVLDRQDHIPHPQNWTGLLDAARREHLSDTSVLYVVFFRISSSTL